MLHGGAIPRDALDDRKWRDDRRHRGSAIHHLRMNEVGPIGHTVQVGVHAKRLLDEVVGGKIEDADLAHHLLDLRAARTALFSKPPSPCRTRDMSEQDGS